MSAHWQTNMKKYKPHLIVFVLLIVCAVVARTIYLNIVFRASSTYPNTRNFPTSAPYIDINVNHTLAKQDITKTISSQPNVVESIEQIGNKTIRLKLAALEDGTHYKLAIDNIRDTGGKVIRNVTLTIKAKYIPFDRLSKELQRAISDDQDQEQQTSDPILSHLPYGGLNYRLTAEVDTSNNGKVVINAQIILSASDVRTNKQAAIKLYKRQIQGYIKSLGLNPANYSIRYTIVEPTI